MTLVHPTWIGWTFGLALGLGVSVYQAEPRTRDGRTVQVVAWVYKNQVVETPLWQRCLMVGIGFGLLGAAAGSRIATGGKVLPALVGAILFVGLLQYVGTLLPPDDSRPARQSWVLATLFAGLLGAAAGAEASRRVQTQRRQHP